MAWPATVPLRFTVTPKSPVPPKVTCPLIVYVAKVGAETFNPTGKLRRVPEASVPVTVKLLGPAGVLAVVVTVRPE
jgi:hypothetical protein